MDSYGGREPEKSSEGFSSWVGKIVGAAIAIPIGLAMLNATLGNELRGYWDFGKTMLGKGTDCSEVAEYLDEVATDYKAFHFDQLDSLDDYEAVTAGAVSHARRLDPPEVAKDFQAANLNFWLYMRDDFMADAQRHGNDEETLYAIIESENKDFDSSLNSLVKSCPSETRDFERTMSSEGF